MDSNIGRLDLFLTQRQEPKESFIDAVKVAIEKKFQDERRLLIDFLFTNIHYRRIKELPLETMLIDINLHHGVGPSRAMTINCLFTLVYDALSLALANSNDRLHVGLAQHGLAAVSLHDATGERSPIEISLRSSTTERREDSSTAHHIRTILEQLFDNRPKPSPFLLPIESSLRESIINILLTSDRVQRRLQQQGFRRVAKSDQRGLVLLR